MSRTKDYFMDEEEKKEEAILAEQEHIAGFHTLYQPNCPTCWAENLVIKTNKETND